uniref:Uncharacterized protein n=1 Tax=Arundo donax TaxID=35708 RepID=A0A0A9G3U9_ARUDO
MALVFKTRSSWERKKKVKPIKV